jgi:hypothetical protein
MSTVAVFMLLGGGAYAARKLPRDSVGATQIRASAVGSAEVKNKSLLIRDFKAGQLPTGPRGATGPSGPAGAGGGTGPPGAAGSAVAFASMKSNGDPQTGLSKNLVASNNTASAGIYCLEFATAPRNVVATIDYSFSGEGFISATTNPADVAGECGLALPSANVSVLTRNLAGAVTAEGFFIAVIN